jgi:glycosyltransferase involved in cell wall biosynthesis
MKYLPWNEKSEILDLSQINIGIMPLEDDVWSEGKCGFKLIQYLALGIPAVASPVGVNKEIVDQQNGFLCSTESDWFEALDKLINNVSLRQAMGRRGREKIINRYSVQANEGAFLELFN